METGLRILLLVLGALIVAGVIWDARRARLNRKQKNDNGNFNNNEFRNDPRIELSSDFRDENNVTDNENNINNINDDEYQNAYSKEFNNGSKGSKDGFNGFKNENLDPVLEPKHLIIEQDLSVVSKPTSPTAEILALNVMARQPGVFSGKKLMDAMKDASLYFGDLHIFHRYENMDGTGKVLFSVASAVEPGMFDMTQVDSFVTPGISLFFTLTQPNQSIAAFELMLRTAKQLAARLDGEVRDDKRKILTSQGIEYYREKVRGGRDSVRMVGS